VIERAVMLRVAVGALALGCALATGCAGMQHPQPQEPVATAPTPAPVPVAVPAAVTPPPPVTAPAAVAAPETQETAVQAAVIEPVPPTEPVVAPRATVPKPPVTSPPVPKAVAPKPPVAIVATPAPAPPIVPKVAAAPVAPKPSAAPVAAKPYAAPLDFKSLGTRLRQTKAIGVMTKLSLKNQVDDLLAAFRAYHKGQGTTTLAELRRSYDMLLLKVLSLLQDSDPTLAADIVQSRAAIWGILADPRKFTESNLMAGATP
jgi:hypothetical protein